MKKLLFATLLLISTSVMAIIYDPTPTEMVPVNTDKEYPVEVVLVNKTHVLMKCGPSDVGYTIIRSLLAPVDLSICGHYPYEVGEKLTLVITSENTMGLKR